MFEEKNLESAVNRPCSRAASASGQRFERKLSQLPEIGCNVIRDSHNPSLFNQMFRPSFLPINIQCNIITSDNMRSQPQFHATI